MPIYDEIKKKFILPNAYEDWKEYRETLTGTIVRLGRDEPGKTLSVIGAGRCNDIDLNKLCSCFSVVTLSDWDPAAMREAAARLTEPDIRRIRLTELSLTGLTESDISGFCEETVLNLRRCGSSMDADSFFKTVLRGIEKMKSAMISSEDDILKILPKSDIVLCSGVFSQLFSTVSFFIRSCAMSLPSELAAEAMKAADRMDRELAVISRELVPVITEAIVKSAKDYVVFGNEYSEEYPVEGACRCIDTVRAFEKVLQESVFMWDFNRSQNIKYEMLIQVVKGKNDSF